LKHWVGRHPGRLVARAEDLLGEFGHDILGAVLVEGVQCERCRAMIECMESSHTRFLTEEELVLVSALFWAIGLVADNQSRQTRPVNNYCLVSLLETLGL
jgi:hypothetical protein